MGWDLTISELACYC